MNSIYLHDIRKFELDYVFDMCDLGQGSEILDFGSGDGFVLSALRNKGFKNVFGLEIDDSNYIIPPNVKTYNGKPEDIPYTRGFDVIYSSNVLEHVNDIEAFLKKFDQMLNKGGVQIHVMPTHYWKRYSFVFYYYSVLKYLLGFKSEKKTKKNEEVVYKDSLNSSLRQSKFYIGRHGSRGTSIDEFKLFNPKSYRDMFKSMGFDYSDFKIPLIYSGHEVFSKSLSISFRTNISEIFGYSCHAFIIKRNG